MSSRRVSLVFALLALLASLGAAAQATRTLVLEDLTWIELRDEIARGKTIILVPIGGTEQNGRHMALGKHNARVKVLAERIARELGNALIAPAIVYTPEEAGHLKYPGTIGIPDSAFESTLEAAARSFQRHGFRDVVFLGDHGGYRTALNRAVERLNREWKGTRVRAHALPEYYEAQDHAGAADTSLTLATNPALVRSPLPSQAGEGATGMPREASLQQGLAAVDRIISRSVSAIRRASAR
jgi:creatinine amidohydrolase/Fe(II)-dependent formamide hydrolase-like protein